MTYYYQAYGLSIQSDIDFPELALSNPKSLGSTDHSDISIISDPRIDFPTDLSVSKSMHCSYAVEAASDSVYLHWAEIGTFCISRGKEIAFHANANCDLGILRVVLLGSVMAILLFQRGITVLHGSAVEIDGVAAAFIGGKGAGKSTIAAALQARGHRVLTDDVIAVEHERPGTVPNSDPFHKVLPSFAQIKLWPDAALALGHDVDALPKVTALYEKVALRSSSQSNSTSELAVIFVLGIEAELRIERLSTNESFAQIIGNSYVSRFGESIVQLRRQQQFLAAGKLVKSVGVHRLLRPAEFSRIGECCETVEATHITLASKLRIRCRLAAEPKGLLTVRHPTNNAKTT